MPNGYYKIAIGAMMSDGTQRWGEVVYFYTSATTGIGFENIMRFKIWTGFNTATKDAISSGTDTINSALGIDLVDTYAYISGVISSSLVRGNGVSTVIPYNDINDERVMVTYNSPTTGYAAEADIMINQAFPWATNGAANAYDIKNVITHELGHAVGLTDKYESFASDWTMYGIAEIGETKKRSLHSYDVKGLRNLYIN